MVSGKLETVSHIPKEVSRHTYFYIKEEGGRKVYHTSENEGLYNETLLL